MHSIFQDVGFGLRMLAKNPGITLVAILTLGLGIAANTATFSLCNTFLRKPVSFPEVERLVMVLNHAPGQQGQDWSAASPADFLDWKKEARSFAGSTAIGLPASYVLARLLSSLLYGVRAADFFSYAPGAILLAVVVVLGCYIPARRATRVDPMSALRYE
jgi:ABC-type antimicrobial peptide transport system permease subunit